MSPRVLVDRKLGVWGLQANRRRAPPTVRRICIRITGGLTPGLSYVAARSGSCLLGWRIKEEGLIANRPVTGTKEACWGAVLLERG
jgi:hypothetical protein